MSGIRIVSPGNPLGGITGLFERVGGASGLRDGQTTAKVLTSDGTKLSFSVANADARLSAEEVTRRFGSNGSRVVASTLEGSDQPNIISRYDSKGALTAIAVPMKGRSGRYAILSGQDMERFMAADPLLGAVAANGLRQPAEETPEQAETSANTGATAAQTTSEADGGADAAAIAIATADAEEARADAAPSEVAAGSGIVNLTPEQMDAVEAEMAAERGESAASEAGANASTSDVAAVTGAADQRVSDVLGIHANNGDAMQRYETADGGHVYIFSDGTNMTGALYVPEGPMGNTGTYYDAADLVALHNDGNDDGWLQMDGSVQIVANAVSGGTVNVATAQSSWARNSFGANATPEAYAESMERNQTFAQRIDLEGMRADPNAASLGSIAEGADAAGTDANPALDQTAPQVVPGFGRA